MSHDSAVGGLINILASSILPAFIPISDVTLRIQVSMFIMQLVNTAWAPLSRRISTAFAPLSGCRVIISDKGGADSDNGDYASSGGISATHLYQHIEAWLVNTYPQQLRECAMEFKHGDVAITIPEQAVLYITPPGDAKLPGSPRTITVTMQHQARQRVIIFSGWWLPLATLQAFVHYIILQKPCNNVLVVYRPILQDACAGGGNRGAGGRGRDRENYASVDWATIYIKTNKSRANTIYSEAVTHELFDDIAWFMGNETWYTARGIPYKRGYLLNGAPGTGKTSVAKIVANEYNIPIFVMDLAVVKTDNDLIKLATEMNSFARDKRYVLLIEDLDRSALFAKDRWGETHTDLNFDCFLNFLDGVVETHGRILIVTANDASVFSNVGVAFRPGRIDKRVDFDYCTPEQIERLLELFFGPQEAHDFGEAQITPAELVKLMQTARGVTPELIKQISEFRSDAGTGAGGGMETGLLGAIGNAGRMRRRRRAMNNSNKPPLVRRGHTQLQKLQRLKKVQEQIVRTRNALNEAIEKGNTQIARAEEVVATAAPAAPTSPKKRKRAVTSHSAAPKRAKKAPALV